MYIIKIFEKGQASEVMSDRYGHKTLAQEFYFRGNYFKLVRSLKQFELINSDILKWPEEVFELFSDLTLSTSMYENKQNKWINCKVHRLLKICVLIIINLYFPLPKYDIISPILLLNVYAFNNK